MEDFNAKDLIPVSLFFVGYLIGWAATLYIFYRKFNK